MREIIFRAKTVCDGDWVYGGITWNPSKKEVFIHTEWDEGKVIPETVGQYTGLTDKNGTKIFEGDIIQDSNYPEYVFRIEYHNGTIIASEIHTFDKVYLDNFICFNIFEAFVIGNIHDNPELLNK